MAVSGSMIDFANIQSSLGTSWRNSTTVGYTGTYTYYVSAPAFHIDYWIKGSGWLGYQEGSIHVYPYNPSTGKFGSSVYDGSDSCRGSTQISWAFSHNYNGGTTGDVPDVHLWKIEVYSGNNDGSSGGTLYVGGMGLLTESLYNNYFKYRRIYCSEGNFWTGYTDEGFLSAKGYSCMQGTQIREDTGTYLYICANHEIP